MADEYDITVDLVDGRDGALGDDVPGATPEGAVPAGGNDTVRVQEVAPTQTSADASIREQLSSAFKGTPEPAAGDVPTPSAAAPVPALTKDDTGKYRNNDGTFASAEQIAAFESAQVPAQPEAPSFPLTGLTPVEQEQFKSLPAEIQQFVGRTMEGLNARQSQYSEYDFLEQQLIGPRREAWAEHGLNPATALNQLLSLSDFATRDPGNFILSFAKDNGIDLDALLDEAEAAQANVPPEVAQLSAQVQQLTQQINQGQQASQEQAHAANLSLVQNFSEEKDAGGNLKRPYIAEVMQGWGAQITALRAQNPNMAPEAVLQQAYETACWANPTVRDKMQQATEAQKRAAEAERVRAAKAAGASVNGDAPSNGRVPSGSTGDNANLSLRDELRNNFAASRN